VNPAIIIPTYWAEKDVLPRVGEVGVYDHATSVTKPIPELETCLESLEKVRGVMRVIVLMVADLSCQDSARARVNGICRRHPNLSPVIVGQPEANVVTRAIEGVAPRLEGDAVSLRGYGAIRNMGLAVAAILGHDVAVFMDDDEVALDENFLIDAVYGLGSENRQGIPIKAKTGYFITKDDSPLADAREPKWYNRYWSKRLEFNEWMGRALTKTRISRSNVLCGGCFAVSADAFCNVAFDPIITRGEDLDYLINLRMFGYDVWFDNQWRVRHLPPKTPSHAARFLQDVYRWEYEVAKLSAANESIGMHKVTPESLDPYPRRWLSPEVSGKIMWTSLLRAIGSDEHLAYLQVFFSRRWQARSWARRVSRRYLQFQTQWPQIMAALWSDRFLGKRILNMGTPPAPRSHVVPSVGVSGGGR